MRRVATQFKAIALKSRKSGFFVMQCKFKTAALRFLNIKKFPKKVKCGFRTFSDSSSGLKPFSDYVKLEMLKYHKIVKKNPKCSLNLAIN